MQQEWYNRRWAVVLLHILAWGVLFSLPYILRPGLPHHQEPMVAEPKKLFIFFMAKNCLWVALFYLNAYLLMPRLFYHKRFGRYTLSLAFCFALSIGTSVFLTWLLYSQVAVIPGNAVMLNLIIFLFIIATSTAYRLLLDKQESDRLIQARQTENLKTELSLLRSQVSPHFMFNVLNNMVSLARKKSDLLEPSLIKLSSIMRYMLYEGDGDKVPLEKEVEYLQSYIDLQQQRFGKQVAINVSFNGADGAYYIEPMLLIPFVENAFKHGTGLIEAPLIEIELRAVEGRLHFRVANRFSPGVTEIKDPTSGIGLVNVKRRLELLYPERHQLLIEKSENRFHVSLQIQLL